MKKIIFIIHTMLMLCLNAVAQDAFTVTGKVIDGTSNEPLIGVNVTIKNEPGLGTITDINGKFTIKDVTAYNILIFSYVGYDQLEVPVKNKRTLDIVMKESENNLIDEVVITGTGLKKKVNLTGAITNVDVKALQSNPSGPISTSLAGVVPGVQAITSSGRPGSTSEFWIRSISTFGASTSALVLVDGFERDLDEINVEDIESFTVLKDASETAIYGSRGANGVVLITTRRGKSGKININVKGEAFYNQPTQLPDFVDGYTFASMANEARITRNQDALYTPEELEMFRLQLDPDLYPSVDWMDVMMRNGSWSERGSISLTGGGNTARYYVGGSFLSQQGLYKTDAVMKDYDTNANYNKWNYRVNLDVDITKTTLLKLGVAGALDTQKDPGVGSGGIWNSIMGYNPIMVPVMYSNGYVPTYKGDLNGDGFNPWVLATQTGYQERWNNNMECTLELQQKLDFLTKGLSFKFRFGYDTYNKNWKTLLKWPEQYRATPRYRDENGELVFTRIVEEKKMEQTSGSDGTRKEFLEWQFDYSRTFFRNHYVNAVLKYNQQANIKTQNVGTDIKNGIDHRNQGFAGRFDYNWKHRYYVNFNFGYTGSENFHKNHRWGFFPAISAAWNLSEEPIIKKVFPWLDLFKVRYSWGKVGNDNIGTRFPYLYTLNTGDGFNSGDFGYSRNWTGRKYDQLASTDVSWEISTKQDLGIDFSIFNDAFSGTFDYFTERRKGIYMSRNYLPYYIGLQSNPSANVGEVKAHGMDGNIAFKQRIGNVNLIFRANMTISKNEIVERDEQYNIYEYRLQKGHRVNQAMGLISLGLFKDYEDIRNSPRQTFGDVMPGDIKYKDVNGDGVVNGDDEVAIGSTTKPNFTYGFGFTAQWKGIDVNMHFQGVGKSSYFIKGSSVWMFTNVNEVDNTSWGNLLSGLAHSDRWISHEISGTMETENPNAEYPRLSYGGNGNNYRNSTFWLRDGSYLRLKTLDIGYSLPSKLVRKLHCNTIRFFFIGTNLLTWSKFDLWDPEMGSSDGKNYPLNKSYSLGISVNL
mgnify:FL=1